MNKQNKASRAAANVVVQSNPEEDFTGPAYLGFHVFAIATGAIFSAWSLAIPDYFHFFIGAYFSVGLLISLLILQFAGDRASRNFSLCVVPAGVMLLQGAGLVLDLSTYDFRVFPAAFALVSIALAGFLGRSRTVLTFVAAVAFLSVLGSEFYYTMIEEHDLVEMVLMFAVLTFSTVVSFQFFRTRTQLVEARKDAEQALALKNRFISNMSHEIRTPLAGIVGLTQLIPLAGHEGERERLVSGLQSSTESLRVKVNEMLDFQKLELTQHRPDPVEVNVRSLIAECSSDLWEELRNRGLNYSLRMHENVPECVKLDIGLFRTVIRAILSNAAKFTHSGEVSVTVDGRALDGRAQHEAADGAVVGTGDDGENDLLLDVAVADTGIGMSADFLERADEPFVQGEDGYAKRFAGVGLGLARARLAIRQLNGSMTIRSTPGAGTTAYITVPVQDLSTEKDTPE
ncbi:MAG: sensor histidine kinase [Spirochaetia bacterium]